MMKKQKYSVIEHPDQFIEGKKYSVMVEGEHRYRKCIGIFIEMESEWCKVCQQNHLLIRLKRSNGRIVEVCWNYLGVDDWREVN